MPLKSFFVPLFTLVISISFFAFFYAYFYHNNENNVTSELKIESHSIKYKIEDDINNKILALIRMSNRISRGGAIKNDELKEDAKLYIKHIIGYQSIKLTDQEFHLRWSIPAKDKYQILNQNNISDYDLKQMKKNQVTLTKITHLTNGDKTFSAYIPVYIKNDFKGFIICVFKINTILDNLLKKEINYKYSIVISDKSNKDVLKNNTFSNNSYISEENIQLYNTKWNLTLIKNKKSFYNLENKSLILIIIFGFLLSVAYFLIALFLQNISHKKKQIKESQEYYRLITENMSDLICLYDKKWNYIYISPSCFELLGFSPDELIGKSHLNILHPDDKKLIDKILDPEKIEDLKNEYIEYRIKRKDQSYIWVETIYKVILDDKNNITGYQSSSRNITEKVKVLDNLIESELRFKKFSELAFEGITISRKDDPVIIDTNQAMADLFGYSISELIGMEGKHLIKTEYHNSIIDKVKNDYSESYEALGIKKDGTVFPIEILGKNITYQDIEHRVTVIRDITERKKAEEEIIRVKEQLEMVIKATNDGYWDWDFKNNKIYFSPRWKKMLGYEDNELENSFETWEKLIFQEDKAKALKLMKDYNSGKIPRFRQQQRFHHKDGSVVYILSKAISIKDEEGKVTRIVGAHKDITPNILNELELKKAKEEADSANRLKSDFLANMSHEIRTPMNGVIGMTELLLSTKLSYEQKDLVETIKFSGETLLSIINDILDFSKIESGKMQLENSTFELRRCIEDVFDLLSLKALNKNIEILYYISPNIPDFIISDIVRIRQIIINLLNNSLKFTEEGEIVILVDLLESKEENIKLKFTVKDTGIGIPKEKINILFNPFTQADSSITRKYGGTGLGLSICKKIIKLMNGDIWIESVENVGTSIFFTIDVGVSPNSTKEHLKHIIPELANKSILIFMNNHTKLNLIEKQVEQWGMKTESTSNQDNLMDLIKTKDFDLILVDIDDKLGDYKHFVQKIKHISFKKQITVLAACYIEKIKYIESYNLFKAFINKPIRQDNLFNAIIKSLGETNVISDRSITMPDNKLSSILPLKILLAEDNLINQKLVIKMLEKLGYVIDIANNGLEAIQALQNKSYDIIFMDMQMPEIDGLEATKYIKANFKIPTKIIAITANAMSEDRDKCIQAGMNDYISKPISLKDLQKVLIKWGK